MKTKNHSVISFLTGKMLSKKSQRAEKVNLKIFMLKIKHELICSIYASLVEIARIAKNRNDWRRLVKKATGA